MGGWVVRWVVGNSDENLVVSLDLELDFGLRLRVCQYRIVSSSSVMLEILRLPKFMVSDLLNFI